jgi:glycosyltransferase involved in cell wall biosynthesis
MIVANPCDPDWRVMKEARTLADAGFEVTILAWDRDGTREPQAIFGKARILRIRSPYLPGPGGISRRILDTLRFWRRVASASNALRPEIVYCHDLLTLPIGVFLTIGRRRRRLVYDAHEVYWLMFQPIWPAPLVWFARAVEKILIRFASRVITVSDLAVPLVATRSESTVIGNWYDPIDRDIEAGIGLRTQVGIPRATFCLGCVGSLDPRRLIGLLIAYASTYPDTAVIVAGRGSCEAKLREAAATIANLHFLGWQSDPTPIYAAVDALFYGSAADPYGRISSPNTLFLAIAMKIPLITTDVGEAGTVISSSGGGVVLAEECPRALRDAIETMITAGTREKMMRSLQAIQPRYRWAEARNRLLELYEDIRH